MSTKRPLGCSYDRHAYKQLHTYQQDSECENGFHLVEQRADPGYKFRLG